MPAIVDVLCHVVRVGGGVVRGHRLGFGVGVVLRGAERLLGIAPYALAAHWLGGAAPSPPVAFAILAGVLAAQFLCAWQGQLRGFLGAYGLMGAYREAVLEHVGRLPLDVLRRQGAGRVAAVLADDMKRVEDIFTHLAADLASAVAVSAVVLAALAWVDWRLALGLAATVPVAVFALNTLRRFFLARGRGKQELLLDTSAMIVEFVGGLVTLRLFDRAGPWLARLEARFEALRTASLGVEAWGGGSIQLYRLLVEAGLVTLLLAAAGVAGTAEGLDAGRWLLFGLLAGRLLDPLLDAAAQVTALRALSLGEERLRRLLAQPPLPEGNADLPADAPPDLSFEGVGFRYGGGDGEGDGEGEGEGEMEGEGAWVLRDVSFSVPAGTVTAIVGPSGAGKSTVLYLLARFADPQAGVIRLGGVDLRRLCGAALYRRLGIVFQDVQLFEGSILDNVRLGRPEAGEAEVAAACRAAGCDGFLGRLPDGLHSRIGENGQRLSGGERQRLSIARALLKDAPVLLLDEATASVDPEAQHDIQQALSRLARGRTVVVIAHRLHTIRNADQILVMDHGRIVERGRHADLLAADGLYAALWRRQD